MTSDDEFQALAEQARALRRQRDELERQLYKLDNQAVIAGRNADLGPTVIGAAIGVSASQIGKIKQRVAMTSRNEEERSRHETLT